MAKKKSKAVFLGAGASAALGYPVTAQILPKIVTAARKKKLFGQSKRDNRAREHLLSGLEDMFRGWNGSVGELPSITDVLSLIDYEHLTLIREGFAATGTAELHMLLEFAIYEVISDVYHSGPPEKLRGRFVQWLLENNKRTALITTNYDTEVDMGLFSNFNSKEIVSGFDFGYQWRDVEGGVLYPRPADPLMRIYKLHGSLNCLCCQQCKHTYINLGEPIDEIAWVTNTEPANWNSCDCGYNPLSLVIVAPSLVRDIRNIDLLQAWKSSLEWLRRASHWYIIGYSFPVEDLAIRSMFMRAQRARWDAGDEEPKVTVVQRDCDEALKSRYEVLFGKCKWVCGGLEEFIDSEGY